MYFTRLPDNTDPAFDEPAHFSRFGRQNIIFNAISYKSYCERHVGCLSIKIVKAGEEFYRVDNRELALRPGQFLLLNDEQEYGCRVDSSVAVKVQSVFFSRGFVSSVFRDASFSEEVSLDNPGDDGRRPLEFFQALHDMDALLERQLAGLMGGLDVDGYDGNRVDEYLIFLLQHLIRVQKKEVERVRRVSAVKATTRKEIYKRLCVAKDLLESSFMDRMDLGEISRVACLSVPQLVRQFKIVYGVTPHHYLTGIRLAQAVRLLKETEMPVHEITWRCGFENASAFCRVFRGVYGVSPGGMRGGVGV